MRLKTIVAALFSALLPLSAGAAADDEPPQKMLETSYHVRVDGRWGGVGTALSKDGWLVTSQALIDKCPRKRQKKSPRCDIMVGDHEEKRWMSATVVGTDATLGLVLLSVAQPLDEVAHLDVMPPNKDEAVFAAHFDGGTRHVASGTISALTAMIVRPFKGPKTSRRALISTITFKKTGFEGSGLFTPEGRLVGIIIGSVEPKTALAGTVAATSQDVRAFYDRRRAEYDRARIGKTSW